MYVVAQHTVLDHKKTMEAGRPLFTPPPGFTLHLFLTGPEVSKAICLWEADSVEVVRDLVDGAIGQYSRNEYFSVDEQTAVGLHAATTGAAAR